MPYHWNAGRNKNVTGNRSFRSVAKFTYMGIAVIKTGFMKNLGADLILEMLATINSEPLALSPAIYLDSVVTLFCYIIKKLGHN
jgi:hypothetical protein